MARMSRSTGGISTRCPATRGTGGGITIRRPPSRMKILLSRTAPAANLIPNTNCSTPGSLTPTATGSSRCTTSMTIEHPFLGTLELLAGGGPTGAAPTALFCENETNVGRLYGAAPTTPYPKDGINDHVISGAPTVNPADRGTKAAFWYQVMVAPGETAELRLRLRPVPGETAEAADPLGSDFDQVIALRRAEADEFYGELTPAAATADEAMVMRQAFAGMLWSKQLYAYDVGRWLDGDPTQPTPPPGRLTGRNSRWRNFNAFDIMSMPDKWEYPWFAAWDLAFHCVALAHVDPAFAKYQLILLCREWFQHPSGALPAYEWDFGDVNPPVQAWAALEVFAIDGGRDVEFLSRIFDKLLLNFTWWVKREDTEGNNLLEGGFLGLDNIGPIDRSHLPVGGILEQCDATGWMGFYAMAMASIELVLDRSGQRPGIDLVLKFLEHFAGISDASMLERSLTVGKQFADFLARQGLADREKLGEAGLLRGEPGERRLLLSVTGTDRLEKLFVKLFDEGEFLSPYGLRALSAYHREHPYELDVEGVRATIDYEPAESTTAMFGGNSNWRGPLWFPLNYLVVSVLERYYRFLGDELTIEYPAGSGYKVPLDVIALDLQDRLISLFVVGPDGRRPCFGWV